MGELFAFLRKDDSSAGAVLLDGSLRLSIELYLSGCSSGGSVVQRGDISDYLLQGQAGQTPNPPGDSSILSQKSTIVSGGPSRVLVTRRCGSSL